MKRLITILIFLIFGFTVNAQIKTVYRVALKKQVKDITRDTLYLDLRVLQFDRDYSRTWAKFYPYNTINALNTDSAFVNVFGQPIDIYYSSVTLTQANISDSLRKYIALKFKVNLGKVDKIR